MSTETDILNIQAQIPVESDGPVDILNREEFVDQLMDLINAVSDSNGSCTFSLNGKWGVGKSFVLRMLEERLFTWQGGTKYVVFHYNCWKYDYYEEPLFAIVASMLEGIDEETHFFSQEARDKAKEAFAIAEPCLKNIASAVSQSIVGFDAVRPFSMLMKAKKGFKNIIESGKSKRGADDPFFHFNKSLQEVRKQMKILAKQRKIVVVVDELDRCLPEYEIKVLERLHHLFYGMENCVVAVAVAKDQLENTIKQVFGEKIDIDQYLKKFVDFELNLDVGSVEGSFSEKYADYFALFDRTLVDPKFDVDEFCSALFGDLSVRTQEHIVERVKTIHRILFSDSKKDYSILCFELMWAVVKEEYKCSRVKFITIMDSYFCFDTREPNIPIPSKLNQYLMKWKDDELTDGYGIHVDRSQYGVQQKSYDLRYGVQQKTYNLREVNIPSLLLFYLSELAPVNEMGNNFNFRYLSGKDTRFADYPNELKRFINLLKIIK